MTIDLVGHWKHTQVTRVLLALAPPARAHAGLRTAAAGGSAEGSERSITSRRPSARRTVASKALTPHGGSVGSAEPGNCDPPNQAESCSPGVRRRCDNSFRIALKTENVVGRLLGGARGANDDAVVLAQHLEP